MHSVSDYLLLLPVSLQRAMRPQYNSMLASVLQSMVSPRTSTHQILFANFLPLHVQLSSSKFCRNFLKATHATRSWSGSELEPPCLPSFSCWLQPRDQFLISFVYSFTAFSLCFSIMDTNDSLSLLPSILKIITSLATATACHRAQPSDLAWLLYGHHEPSFCLLASHCALFVICHTLSSCARTQWSLIYTFLYPVS